MERRQSFESIFRRWNQQGWGTEVGMCEAQGDRHDPGFSLRDGEVTAQWEDGWLQ